MAAAGAWQLYSMNLVYTEVRTCVLLPLFPISARLALLTCVYEGFGRSCVRFSLRLCRLNGSMDEGLSSIGIGVLEVVWIFHRVWVDRIAGRF